MKLVNLTVAPGLVVTFHRHITVVTGMDRHHRLRLVAALMGLAQGAAPVGPGLLEAHGVLFDLSEEMLALIDLAVGEIRPVVSASDVTSRDPRPSPTAEKGQEEATVAEEIEWHLLRRLGAQRATSLAGSMPLLLDDVFTDLDAPSLHHVLDRVMAMAEDVQVIIVTDNPDVAEWVLLVGAEQAAIRRTVEG